MEPPVYHLVDNNDDSHNPTRRQQLTNRLRQLRVPDWAREPANWISGLIAAVVLGVALALLAGLIWLLWTIITGIGDGLESGADAVSRGADNAGALAADVGRWITHGPITHTINDPVRAYLDTHTTGLAATGRDLWILWLVAVCALYLAAMFGSRYGRVGWAVIGVLTAAGAWHGTTLAASRPTAAATTAVLWLLLSLLAYTRPVARIDWDALQRRMARDRRHLNDDMPETVTA